MLCLMLTRAGEGVADNFPLPGGASVDFPYAYE